METLNKIAGAVSNVVPESVSNTLFGENRNKHVDEHGVPTAGPGHNTYGERPLVTTTNETASLGPDSSNFANLSHGGTNTHSHTEAPSFVVANPLKDDIGTHKRADSGHAEYDENTPRYGRETSDDGIRRKDDSSLHTTEGYARPKFHGSEDNDDGIRRSDGRERVQFDSADGSTGSLRPSGGDLRSHSNDYSGGSIAQPHSNTQYHKTTDIVTEIGNLSLNSGKPQTSDADLSKYGVTEPTQSSYNDNELGAAQTSQHGGLEHGTVILNAGGHQHQTHTNEYGLPSAGRENDVPRERDTIADRQGYLGNTNSGEYGNISSRSGNDVGEATSSHSTGLAHAAQSVASQGAPITNLAHIGQQREGLSSSNEPRAQGGSVNYATTNALPLMSNLNQPIGGPIEPSVGAHPASAVQPTQSHQGAGRPMESPDHIVGGAAAPQLHQITEAGHQYVRSSGMAADGGDFDAAAPGAGHEADRLLEQSGIHRTDKRDAHTATGGSAPTKAGGIMNSLLHHGDHSSHKTNPAPHPATTNVAEPHPRTGHSGGGITGMTHTAGGSTGGTSTGGTTALHDDDTAATHSSGTSTEKKPLTEKIKEKLHLGGH